MAKKEKKEASNIIREDVAKEITSTYEEEMKRMDAEMDRRMESNEINISNDEEIEHVKVHKNKFRQLLRDP